jgi:hypothetical protein
VGAAALVLLAGGCNRYELFRVGGFQQTAFSNKADILFVIDNSDSMVEETTGLAENFSKFIEDLQARDAAVTYDGLPDAVANYESYVQDRGAFVDYQFGITTTDTSDLGENGALVGKVPIVAKDDPNLVTDFSEDLLCNAADFESVDVVPDDPNYTCGQGFNGVSKQYLDCLCGTGKWTGHSGSSSEAGLEATYKAMCRSVPNPPIDCMMPVATGSATTPPEDEFNGLEPGEVLSNEGFLRDGSTFIPVVVSDEGDSSPRVPTADPVPALYEALYGVFQHRMSFVAIAPTLSDDYKVVCPGASSDWGVIRYKYFTEETNGLFIPIDNGSIVDDTTATNHAPHCGPADFADALGQLGDLLQNLFNAFPLQSVPKLDTILVFVDGEQEYESESVETDQYGITRYSDGWTYRPEDNSVVFHGSATPGFDSNVQVYYEPVDGMPRQLPF